MKKYKFFLFAVVVVFLQLFLLFSFGQPLVSKTGHVYLFWFGGGVEDSQQVFDWYSFSHIIHGIIFYFLISYIFNKTSSVKILIAVCLESFWEVLENSPMIINRYRETAIAAGYFGDSVLNSFFDVMWMIIGFYFAKRFGWKVSLATVIFFELLTLYFIRDNLTLNIIMLLFPSSDINAWQMGN